MMKHLVLCVMLIGFTGCSNGVGGPCEYQSISGIATIVISDLNITTAKFQPESNAQTNPLLREGTEYYLHQHLDAPVGSRYPARLSVITEGTCTPFHLNLTGPAIVDGDKNDT